MKYFVCSDIHGFYDEFIFALNEQGFDPDNENHCLIVCGDLFDRGSRPVEVMEYVKALPRKHLIWGNHEELLTHLLYTHNPLPEDVTNGTLGTVEALLAHFGDSFGGSWHNTIEAICDFYDGFENYFETKNYIFVHSWIPTKKDYALHHHWNEDWRNPDADWQTATWVNPFDMAEAGFNQTGKTIVFGHWHCSAGWYRERYFMGVREFGKSACFEPYRNKNTGILAIDACTAHTHKVNVVVIEDEEI